MGYLVIAVFFFIIYYFVDQFVAKKSLVRAGKKYSEIIIADREGASERKITRLKTDYYILHQDKNVFESVDKEKADILISDLDYKNLVRFQNLIQDFKNNQIRGFEFFSHKKFRHLVYPFVTKNDTIEILLLQTDNQTVDDFFNKKPKR